MTTSQTKQRTHREDATFRQGRTDDGISRTHRIPHILESNTHNVTQYQKHGKHKLVDSKCMTSIISLLQVIHAFAFLGTTKTHRCISPFLATGLHANSPFSYGIIPEAVRALAHHFNLVGYPTGFPPIPTSV